jgi:glycosyltransferase involved in cell wall biosynthesis
MVLLQVLLQKADIYHFFNVPDVIGLPLILKRGVFIYDVRSPWFSTLKETLGFSLLSRVGGVIERFLSRNAEIVLAACTPLAKRARSLGAKKVFVVPNYPPQSFGPKISRSAMKLQLGLGDSPTVIFVGKLSKLEGTDLLKDIILQTSTSIPSLKFLIVGDGPQKKSVEKFLIENGLTDRVVMTGWVPHSTVADYINAADVGILPRTRTTFSPYTSPENILKVGEYLAVGKPVIAPKMGGFANASFPIVPAEPEMMAHALIEYLSNPREVEDFQRPTWEISHSRLHQVYESFNALDG